MARLNLLKLGHLALGPLRTHEGAPARHISPEMQLRRSVLACLLWENQFYEDGVEIAGRIAKLVPEVDANRVTALAVEAREQMKLRHAPLLLVREMARHKTHRALAVARDLRGGQRIQLLGPREAHSCASRLRVARRH
jgi:60 kDa SS-A/Ro ribonucleoprotein